MAIPLVITLLSLTKTNNGPKPQHCYWASTLERSKSNSMLYGLTSEPALLRDNRNGYGITYGQTISCWASVGHHDIIEGVGACAQTELSGFWWDFHSTFVLRTGTSRKNNFSKVVPLNVKIYDTPKASFLALNFFWLRHSAVSVVGFSFTSGSSSRPIIFVLALILELHRFGHE